MIKIKICGVTNAEDALWAANLGANYVGVNFFKDSPRKVSVEMAQNIVCVLPPFTKAVGVFVNEDISILKKIVQKARLNCVQLHGGEDAAYITDLKASGLFVFKAFRVQDESSIESVKQYASLADMILLDAYKEGLPGGTGEVFNWDIADKIRDAGIRFFLSGGLNPENIIDAVEKVAPFGVDAASGIERTPKKKDYEKMKDFIIKAKNL